MHYLSFLLFSLFIISSNSHPTNAGTCKAGNFGLGQFHGGTRKTLDQRHLGLKVDGIIVPPDHTFDLAQGCSHNFTLISIDGITKFKGFFFRLQFTNGTTSTDFIDTTTMFTHVSSLGRINPLCSSSHYQNVIGIEHTSKVIKSAVSVEFSSDYVGDYILDLHAVVSTESDWVYDQFIFSVKDSDSHADDIASSYISISPSSSLSRLTAEDARPGFSSKYTNRDNLLLAAILVVSAYFFMILFVMIRKAITNCQRMHPKISDERSHDDEEEPNHFTSFIQLIPLIV